MCDELRSNYHVDRKWAEAKISAIVGVATPTNLQSYPHLRTDAPHPVPLIGRRESRVRSRLDLSDKLR
jgi:hypothetical protein